MDSRAVGAAPSVDRLLHAFHGKSGTAVEHLKISVLELSRAIGSNHLLVAIDRLCYRGMISYGHAPVLVSHLLPLLLFYVLQLLIVIAHHARADCVFHIPLDLMLRHREVRKLNAKLAIYQHLPMEGKSMILPRTLWLPFLIRPREPSGSWHLPRRKAIS